jgi:hypothetical protein
MGPEVAGPDMEGSAETGFASCVSQHARFGNRTPGRAPQAEAGDPPAVPSR